MNDKKNDKKITIRLTEEQNALLLEAAIRKGLTVSAFVRMAALERAGI